MRIDLFKIVAVVILPAYLTLGAMGVLANHAQAQSNKGDMALFNAVMQQIESGNKIMRLRIEYQRGYIDCLRVITSKVEAESLAIFENID